MSLNCNNCLQNDHVEDDCPHPATEEYKLWKDEKLRKIRVQAKQVCGVRIGGLYRFKYNKERDLTALIVVKSLHHGYHLTEVKIFWYYDGLERMVDIDKFKADYVEVEMYIRDKDESRT